MSLLIVNMHNCIVVVFNVCCCCTGPCRTKPAGGGGPLWSHNVPESTLLALSDYNSAGAADCDMEGGGRGSTVRCHVIVM